MDVATKEAFIESMFGDNKSRDFRICEAHCQNPQLTYQELVDNLGLDISEDRVGAILRINQDAVLKLFAKCNSLYFKEGRAKELVALYKQPDASKEDKIYILEALRKLLEGNSKSIGELMLNRDNEDVTLKRNDRELQERICADLKAESLL